ncbi:hypothetical protein LTR36_000293 [Oleoguttula mirabilis]|uniref:PIPK domain-containing protein n=1 Tax=Oleoguttula mirabilis TaxID=1507867 RepID=A0AAV9JYI4_9PEZI|nr:hypothetical protein LTR36_000293 [Oleoguttula mirabilis]
MAPGREEVIAQSIQKSLLRKDQRSSFLASLPTYFYTYSLTFECVREELFTALRAAWQINDDDYRQSFAGEGALVAMADMGYSGSTFYKTADEHYLIKSVPRQFEHSFFRDDLLVPYAEYVQSNPSGLLIRITDFLQCSQSSVGSLVGTAPSHHIVMENLLYGQNLSGSSSGEEDAESGKWETWDLKPMSYFYPERDVAGGALASEATKSKLADEFNDKIGLTLDQAEELKAQLAKDTRLLADCNAVDYSLFLIRIPNSASTNTASAAQSTWRTGIPSTDGKFVYRAAILDFFWAKHKVQAMAMTGLINAYNTVDKQGPMSVTADPSEYRERFLKMCEDIVEVSKE